MARSTLNNSIDKANVNDLSGSGYETHVGLGFTGTFDENSDLKGIGFGSVGGGAYSTETYILNLGNRLKDIINNPTDYNE